MSEKTCGTTGESGHLHSALLAWYIWIWLIFGPAVAKAAKKLAVETDHGSTHARKTGRRGIHLR